MELTQQIERLTGRKAIFATARDARRALEADRLGAVYRRINEVFVATVYGSGRFTPKEWDATEGSSSDAG